MLPRSDKLKIVTEIRSDKSRKTMCLLNSPHWNRCLQFSGMACVVFCDACIISLAGSRKGTFRGTPDVLSLDTDRWTLHLFFALDTAADQIAQLVRGFMK